jgi:Pre-toxin TG
VYWHKIRPKAWIAVAVFGLLSACATLDAEKVSQRFRGRPELDHATRLVNSSDVDTSALRLQMNRFAAALKSGHLSKADWRLHDKLLQEYISLKNQSGDNLKIPAKSRIVKSFSSFCLDGSKASPATNEVFKWAKGSSDVPYLRELLAGFAKNKNWSQSDIQSLIWNLGRGANWEDYPDNLKGILKSVDPQAALKLPSALKEKAKDTISDLLTSQVPGLNEAQEAVTQAKNAYSTYEDIRQKIKNLKSNEVLPPDDDAYEIPDTPVYASTESDGFQNQDVTFYNPTNNDVSVDLKNYYLKPARQDVQRIAVVTPQDNSSLIPDLENLLFNNMLRMGVGFTPVLSDVADIYEVLTGKDFVSGHELTSGERVLSGIGIMAGGGDGYRWTERAMAAPEEYAARFENDFAHVAEKEISLSQVNREEIGSFLSQSENEATDLAGRATNVRRFNPTTEEGPLSLLKSDNTPVADTFRSSTYIQYNNVNPETVYRVQTNSYPEGPVGRYWTRTKPEGPLQSTIDSALDSEYKNDATHWIEAQIPPGQTLYEGAAAAQRGLVGGGDQIYIQNFNPDWITQQGKF